MYVLPEVLCSNIMLSDEFSFPSFTLILSLDQCLGSYKSLRRWANRLGFQSLLQLVMPKKRYYVMCNSIDNLCLYICCVGKEMGI